MYSPVGTKSRISVYGRSAFCAEPATGRASTASSNTSVSDRWAARVMGDPPGRESRSKARAMSTRERRLAIEPRPRRLELRGQAEQRRLVAVARDELDGHRQAARDAERQHHRGLAREVEPHGERREVEDPPA